MSRRATEPGSLAVVHLVRAGNPPAALETFLRSYDAYDAGVEHRLVLLLKGYDPRTREPDLLREARSRSAEVLEVGDEGVDITAYLAAAQRLHDARLCFLNSYSEILCDGWLRSLVAPLDDQLVGASAATGSWGSSLSYNLWQLGARGVYADLLGDRGHASATLRGLAGLPVRPRPVHLLETVFNTVLDAPHLGRFPSVHLRTNAFVIDRRLLLSLDLVRPRTKRASYHLESGTGSLTARLREVGRLPVVADRRGRWYPPSDWALSETFWRGDQDALLVADKQTRSYDAARPATRALLSRYAWGRAAEPAR